MDGLTLPESSDQILLNVRQNIITKDMNVNTEIDSSETSEPVSQQMMCNQDVNSLQGSQQPEQQNDKSQAPLGTIGGEKRKSRQKEIKKTTDKIDIDQKIYILDLNAGSKNRTRRLIYFRNAWTCWELVVVLKNP